MKRVAITLSGLLLMILISSGIQADRNIDRGHPLAIKGTVVDVDGDGFYDLVTFGIYSPIPGKKVRFDFLEVAGLSHEYCNRVDKVFTIQGGQTHWYCADIRNFSFKTWEDFLLRIHVRSGNTSGSHSLFSNFSIKAAEGSPEDPEETILILKYP